MLATFFDIVKTDNLAYGLISIDPCIHVWDEETAHGRGPWEKVEDGMTALFVVVAAAAVLFVCLFVRWII